MRYIDPSGEIPTTVAAAPVGATTAATLEAGKIIEREVIKIERIAINAIFGGAAGMT